MGHALFVVLHLCALFFGIGALVLTIPLHLIYAVLAGRSSSESARAVQQANDDGPQVRCPDCRELVRFDARKCKHCGSTLSPAPDPSAPPPRPPDAVKGYIYMSVAVMIALVLITRACTR